MNVLELLLQKCIRACDRGDASSHDLYSDSCVEYKYALEKFNDITNDLEIRIRKQIQDKERFDLLQKILKIIKHGKFAKGELARIRTELEKIYFSFTGVPCTAEIKNGDELHNINCYESLRFIASKIPDNLIKGLSPKIFKKVFEAASAKYQPTKSYGNLYTKFSKALAKINKTNPSLYSELSYAVFFNRNLALEHSHGMMRDLLKYDVKQTTRAGMYAIQDRMKSNSEDAVPQINNVTPQDMDSILGEIEAATDSTFTPQFYTSLTAIRDFNYKLDSDPVEIRSGTQAQFKNDIAIYNPIFKSMLIEQDKQYNKDKSDNDKDITHVYFNNLPYHRPGYRDVIALLSGKVSLRQFVDVAGNREIQLTSALYALENDQKNLAVITFPASKGLLAEDFLEMRQKDITYQTAFNDMLAIAKDNTGKHDFYISPHIKHKIYGLHEDGFLQDLLTKSFEKLGFSPNDKLSPSDRQAVFYHFTKFELTDFIITKLGPKSINFSCKDGIDRGGSSTTYYNLIKSIERGTPMSQDEFERTLHGGPIMVKGRGMNSNIKILWNAIDAYIAGADKNITGKMNVAIPVWLREWHRKHAIHGLKEKHVDKLEQYNKIIHKEEKQASKWYSFNSESTKTKKHQLASDLLSDENKNKMLAGKQVDLQISADDLKMLREEGLFGKSRLSKIVSKLENDGVLRLTPKN